MATIENVENCCNCNACGDACVKGAISFERNNEGFLVPLVDKAKCSDCGRCLAVCPQVNSERVKSDTFDTPKCFVAVHKSLPTRFDSTSGGAFSALAKVIYRKHGFVGGAVWDEDLSIRHILSNNQSDLPRLRSSKYAQSDVRGFYRAVKDALQTGVPVLACGAPCQMGALRLYLGRDYPNLFVMDYICRANASPLVFRKYVDWIGQQHGSRVVSIKCKNKELGWRNLTYKFTFENGDVFYDTNGTSRYVPVFNSPNAFCNAACYDCQYKGKNHCADITVADFWGASKMNLPQRLDNDLGTSLVMVNTARGQSLWNAASKSMESMEIAFDQAIVGNGMYGQSLTPPTYSREEFYRVLNSEGYAGVILKYISPPQETRSLQNGRPSLYRRIRARAGICKRLLMCHWRHPLLFLKMFRINGMRRIVRNAFVRVANLDCHVEIEGELSLGGILDFGKSYYKRQIAPTCISIKKGGSLVTLGGGTISNGADIEVFSGGYLEVGSGLGANVFMTIICSNHITLGRDVRIGRHVTIRDNNGGHWVNLPGYQDSKPIVIGDHAWLCEGCTIMSGVKIGAGAVVSAGSVVVNDVPANTLVMGNPAKVICEHVEWKS